MSRDPKTGRWASRAGRAPEGCYTRDQAAAIARDLVAGHAADAVAQRERRERGPTFAEIAARYLTWVQDVRGAKPATLADYGYQLAPAGRIMAALGDRPAAKITTREIEKLLESIAETGVKPRTVNKVRSLVRAVFNYGAKSSTFGLTFNPARDTDKRREAERPRSTTTRRRR